MTDHPKQEALGLSRGEAGAGSVECLGRTFESEEARRDYFTEKLREKLQDPSFRATPGFPNASDENILRISDPPFYTACPNPFLADIVAEWSRDHGKKGDPYHREPFCSDVSEGKGGKLYKAHTYHTKVPPHAVAKFILHYTEPGDVVLDGFAGSGMTGLGAALCAYPDARLRNSHEGAQWGTRHTVLVDLSPLATFVSYGANSSTSPKQFDTAARKLVDDVREELGAEVYGDKPASYVLWSQVLICSACNAELVFLDVAITDSGSISSSFTCPLCKAETSKRKCDRKLTTHYDQFLGRPVTQNAYQPSRVMRLDGDGLEKLSEDDIRRLQIDWTALAEDVPLAAMMHVGERWGDMYRAGYHAGISHAHHFWTPRNLSILSKYWKEAEQSEYPRLMKLLLTSFMVKTGSRMHNIGMKAGKVNLAGQIFNTLQIPSVFAERNLFELAQSKMSSLKAYFEQKKPRQACAISTSSAEKIALADSSIDYIFVDPPFGSNIMYSEMSFLYEAWLGVETANAREAIVDSERSLDWYRARMAECFCEFHRVLKPGRWITIAFHNSRNDVWNALQEALRRAGFVIADVRVLDKGQGTFKQMTTAGSVEKDLAISAYKPSEALEEAAAPEASSEGSSWSFVKEHLSQLPVAVVDDAKIEVLQERTPKLIFDRMVAFHVVRGKQLPVSAPDFYAGLAQRFPERDGMYFLSEQVAEYDRKRTTVGALRQLDLFVSDEASAIQWVRQQLHDKPQTFQDLQPQYMPETQGWATHEKQPELKAILDENFLHYDGTGPVPSQIHSYLSTNFKDLRNLDKEESQLQEKARDRWYVPDPNKQADIDKLRERTLLKEFEEYKRSEQRKLKVFRTEAVRAGFKAAWQDRNYGMIVKVAEKLPLDVLQEDPTLLMYYDNAMTRMGDE